MLVKALVLSQLDYGSVLLHKAPEKLICRLKRVIHAAFRMACGISKKEDIKSKLKQYGVLSMRKRIALRISVIVHKILNTSPKLSL
jgi:hypothetical protein